MNESELIEQVTNLINQREFDTASIVLKDAISTHPKNASLHYFSGAVEAELTNYDSAYLHFEKALLLMPKLDIARLQLGLLYTSLDKIDDAKVHLLMLKQSEVPYILCFAQGILYLINNEIKQAEMALTQGIDINNDNIYLNTDMRNLVKRMQAHKIENDQQHTDNITNIHLLDIYNTEH
jgi:tetratricopeptide (TPR) repeat protein